MKPVGFDWAMAMAVSLARLPLAFARKSVFIRFTFNALKLRIVSKDKRHGLDSRYLTRFLNSSSDANTWKIDGAGPNDEPPNEKENPKPPTDDRQKKLAESTGRTLTMSLVGNLLIAATKFYAYSVTGHSAMFTEAVHTLVDVGNQAILQIGLRQVQRSPDSHYQYGYGRAAFFYSLITALSTFGFGSLYTFYEGVQHIITPQVEVMSPVWTWGVLGVSLIVDGVVLHRAWTDARLRAAAVNLSTMRWLMAFKDPFTVAVIFEDSAAVCGVGLATLGIAMTQLTGNPMWDGLASLSISLLLAAVSGKLIKLNHDFILGRPLDKRISTAIVREILLKRPSIDHVQDVQSQWLGSSAFSYKAEVDFDGTFFAAPLLRPYEKELMAAAGRDTLREDVQWLLPCFAEDVVRQLEREISAIQREIRWKHPEATFVEIVPDSSQTGLALNNMGPLARKAEWAQLKAHMQRTEPGAQFTLGNIYLNQRQYDKALRPLVWCLEHRRRIHAAGPHQEVAAVLEKLATVHYHLGDYDLAVTAATEAIDIMMVTAPQSLDLAAAHEVLGLARREQGMLRKALDHFRSALALRDGAPDRTPALLARSIELVAEMHSKLPFWHSEGVECYRRLLKLRQDLDGPDSAAVGDVLMRLGEMLFRRGDQSLAVDTMLQALAIVEKTHSSDMLATASVLRTLGAMLMDMHAYKRALPHLQRALSIQEARLDPHHHDTVTLIHQLVDVYSRLGMPLPPHWPN